MLGAYDKLSKVVRKNETDTVPKTAGVPYEMYLERKVHTPAEEKFKSDFYASRCLRGAFFFGGNSIRR